MKGTVGILMLGIFASVFFTGCNSLAGSMEVDARDVGTSVAAEEDAERARKDPEGESESGARLNYTDEERNKEAPDYFEQVLKDRTNVTGGKQAFQIMEDHSPDVTDFQIGALREDKTFIYGYETRLLDADGEVLGQLVHCGAFYNYETGEFQVFHQNVYESGSLEEGKESFYLQVCTSPQGEPGDIFIFDNGFGYLYAESGERKYAVNLDSFVRRQYPDAYSVMITGAVTDGDDRIYMEVSIEKEMLDIDPDENADSEESEEELDKQGEHLEKEIADKVIETVLVYEFKNIQSDMTQKNEAYENQKTEWIRMTSGKEYTSEPDAKEDWAAALKKYPDFWGGALLESYNDLPMYQWKDNEIFAYESDGACLFLAYPMTYTPFTDLKANTALGSVFYAPGGHYTRIYGNAGDITAYNEETISRTYTYVWYEEESADSDGSGNDGDAGTTQVKKTEERTQTIRKTRSRRAPLQQGYSESFWYLPEAGTLGNSIGSDIICSGRDGRVYWIRRGGTLEAAGVSLGENYRPGIISNGSEVFLVASDAGHMYLASDKLYQIDYSRLGGSFSAGDSAYDQMFENLNEDSFSSGIDVYSNGSYFTEKNVLRVDMEVDEELLGNLHEKDPDGGWPESGGTWKGFLLTSQSRGLTYYDPEREEGILLADGYWFQSFLLNGKILSVGFANGDVSYSGLDAAYARVYEYDLDALCGARMEAALDAILAEEEAKRIAESESAAKKESSTELEGVPDPMEQWDQEYKEKYELTFPADGS